jgi:hypothetical protein
MISSFPADNPSMERRKAQRSPTSLSAVVSDLDHPAAMPIRATVANLSGSGAGLWLERPLAVNATIRIDLDGEHILLGDICYCRPHSNGWIAGVRVSHSVSALTSLDSALSRSADSELLDPEREGRHR